MFSQRAPQESPLKTVRDGRTTYSVTPHWIFRRSGLSGSRLELVSRRSVFSVRLGSRRNHHLAALAGLSLAAALTLSWLWYPLLLLGVSTAALAFSSSPHYLEIRFRSPPGGRGAGRWLIEGRREELLEFLQALRAGE